ncbi:similar to L-amino acid oxidase LaoA [Plenodomus lingam JN3]|uniref:Similar to L-amino acid oxidase LaoA n=1 Tax=Leptosphaeria maculans (strain JN3 / isolate v23.1.3 / race Av1-4-5-6-7-8) TaxID=985895 RepID=E4ZRZ0_LEPMJ|nr:similar to L-amino acid oxidase LaoA [Plenodomus lingam JN3]CBX94170.1 similar to L-amino acid oxidase LaoA [Plenodomus lingam JN3]
MVLRFATISAAAVTLLSFPGQVLAEPLPTPHLSFSGPFEVERSGVQNINVVYNRNINGELDIAYGDCDIQTRQHVAHHIGSTHVGEHPLAKRHAEWKDSQPTKFVWRVPEEIEKGCLHAFVGDEIVGRSREYTVKTRRVKKRATFAEISDPMGPWFDGVEYLKQKNANETFVAATKEKKFAILGGGISGLTTALILESVGIHNWKILESSDRLGGRMYTAYLNNTKPEDYQYHEMGPMRFPYTMTDPETNETLAIEDQKMIFQLADILNEINKDNDPALQVKFVPWIQTSTNAPVATTKRRPDGTVPGRLETQLNPSLLDNPNATYSNATAVYEAMAALDDFKALTPERVRFYARDIFRAHKQAVEQGMLDFSEVEYLRYAMGYDANITDQVTTTAVSWPMWEFETVYFMADKWLTIDKGMSRLPEAFHPLVDSRTSFLTKVHGVKHNADTNTVTVFSRRTGSSPWDKNTTTTEEFDYIFNSVPFPLLRFWTLPPHSSLMTRAIQRTVFDGAVKVAMQYSTRFWEHLPEPILGGCGRTSTYGIGQICYPSHHINATGPGTMLTSYISSSDAVAACAMPVEEHIAYIQRAMVEIHGPVADEAWTGNYERHCWEQDEHHAGSWAVPIVPQQQLYLPAFWQTEFNTVFIGEHTSFTHSWVFSALESAVRGSVQMLLDIGLVDEAKEVNRRWMARWINL